MKSWFATIALLMSMPSWLLAAPPGTLDGENIPLYGFQFHLARHPSGVFSKAVSHLHVSGMQPPKP